MKASMKISSGISIVFCIWNSSQLPWFFVENPKDGFLQSLWKRKTVVWMLIYLMENVYWLHIKRMRHACCARGEENICERWTFGHVNLDMLFRGCLLHEFLPAYITPSQIYLEYGRLLSVYQSCRKGKFFNPNAMLRRCWWEPYMTWA